MGTVDFTKEHTKAAGRGSSADSLSGARSFPDFDKQQLIHGMLTEESEKFIRRLGALLPKEVFSLLDVKGGLKEKVYSCFDRHFQAMFQKCAETGSASKSRDNAGYTAEDIAWLLNSFGGSVNTGEIEKKAAARPSAGDLEQHTNSMLRRKNDVGTFLNGDGACMLVACAFNDNEQKPGTVTDVKLCVNIPDSALVSPAFRQLAIARYLITDRVAGRFAESIDMVIESMRDQEGGSADGIAAAIMEKIAELETGGLPEAFDPVRETGGIDADLESIRFRGFSAAVSNLTSLLDANTPGFRFMENNAGTYQVKIREYEDTDTAKLPDERYALTLRLLDDRQLAEDRKAYDALLNEFERAVMHLGNLVEVLYQDSKSVFKVNDFEDLTRKNRSRIQQLLRDTAGDAPSGNGDLRGTISFRADTNRKDSIRGFLARLHERINNMYQFLYPVERRVMEEQLGGLEKEYARLASITDPYRLEPGMALEIDITSIKRRRTTVDSMTAVLREFLRNVANGFYSAALVTFGQDA